MNTDFIVKSDWVMFFLTPTINGLRSEHSTTALTSLCEHGAATQEIANLNEVDRI